MSLETLITQQEVLDRLGKIRGRRPSHHTFRRLLREGLPAHRHPFGERLAYVWDEVLAWLEGRAAARANVVSTRRKTA